MDAPLVVVFPRGQLVAKDKERLTKHGIIAVEADDPRSVMQLNIAPPMQQTVVNGDGVIRAALAAMAKGKDYSTALYFVQELSAALNVQLSTIAKGE